MCAAARDALASPPPSEPTQQATDFVRTLGSATVARDPRHIGLVETAQPNLTLLRLYALGLADSITAEAPLSHYLAAVYGGAVIDARHSPAADQSSAAALVDMYAPALPMWEPDALFSALAAPPAGQSPAPAGDQAEPVERVRSKAQEVRRFADRGKTVSPNSSTGTQPW